MGAGKLRERVYFEARAQIEDAFGRRDGDFERVLPIASDEVLPAQRLFKRGSEQVSAAQVEGVSLFEFKLRYFADLDQITAGHRLVDADTPSLVYDIKSAEPDERRRYFYVMAEKGGTSG